MAVEIWMTDKEVAARLGISMRTLQNWRSNEPERLPPASNIGRPSGRPLWRFRQGDVEDFLRERVVRQRAPKGSVKDDEGESPHAARARERKDAKAIEKPLKSE